MFMIFRKPKKVFPGFPFKLPFVFMTCKLTKCTYDMPKVLDFHQCVFKPFFLLSWSYQNVDCVFLSLSLPLTIYTIT